RVTAHSGPQARFLEIPRARLLMLAALFPTRLCWRSQPTRSSLPPLSCWRRPVTNQAAPSNKPNRRPWSAIARRIRVPLGFAFAALYLWLAHPTRNSLVCGILVVIPGLIIRVLASGHVRKNEQLTTTGPYAYTRNPLYLGSFVIALGFAIAARSWWI